MKTRIITLLIGLTLFSNAQAKMPLYDDDAEFDRCIQMMGDWNRCMSEETRRSLNDVKIAYRDILANPKLKDWNGTLSENQQVLRDMYSSWTAFHNRLCSLSKVASRYTGGWKDEELSCNLYYVMHHKEHMRSLYYMFIDKSKPEDDFITEEHDAKYTKCLEEDGSKDKCLLAEFQRSSEKIKDLYRQLYSSKYTAAWNNGSDFGDGNYRDMFDSWVAYRNRLCSLSVYAYQNFPTRPNLSKNQCLQYLNREKLEALENIYNLSQNADSEDKLHKKAEDGGRKAGLAITPLENRVETTESLIGNQQSEPEKEKTEQKEETPANLPSWARRK